MTTPTNILELFPIGSEIGITLDAPDVTLDATVLGSMGTERFGRPCQSIVAELRDPFETPPLEPRFLSHFVTCSQMLSHPLEDPLAVVVFFYEGVPTTMPPESGRDTQSVRGLVLGSKAREADF